MVCASRLRRRAIRGAPDGVLPASGRAPAARNGSAARRISKHRAREWRLRSARGCLLRHGERQDGLLQVLAEARLAVFRAEVERVIAHLDRVRLRSGHVQLAARTPRDDMVRGPVHLIGAGQDGVDLCLRGGGRALRLGSRLPSATRGGARSDQGQTQHGESTGEARMVRHAQLLRRGKATGCTSGHNVGARPRRLQEARFLRRARLVGRHDLSRGPDSAAPVILRHDSSRRRRYHAFSSIPEASMASEARAATALPQISQLLGRDAVRELLELALGKGAELSEVYAEYNVSSEVTLDEGKLKTLSYGVLAGAGVRAIQGEVTGYAYADDFDMKSLREAARTAAAVAAGGEARRPQALRAGSARPPFVLQRPAPTARGEAEKIALCQRADQ